MDAVGIDVSKGRSNVHIHSDQNPSISSENLTIFHNKASVSKLIGRIKQLDHPKICLESTGVYHESLANYLYNHCNKNCAIYVVNPTLIHDYHPGTLRYKKTDKADAEKIADYIRMHPDPDRLKQYSPEDNLRYQLKIANRNRQNTIKLRVSLENNVQAIAEKTFPGVASLFTSSVSKNGTVKWVDFYHTFWHAQCVSDLSEEAFEERYRKFCKRCHYQFTPFAASNIYSYAKNLISAMPKEPATRKIVQNQTRKLKDFLKYEKDDLDFIIELARELPEFETVLSMQGVGETLAAQLMAELGDVSRFPNRRSIVAFAGIDPKKDDSGQRNPKSMPISHTGSNLLRKTLHLVMNSLMINQPANDPVYQFMVKKKEEGKPYNVYMTAGCNKFLRIYYSKVKKILQP